MLAVELEQHKDQVFDSVIELVEVVDVLLVGAIIGIELIGLKGQKRYNTCKTGEKSSCNCTKALSFANCSVE